MGYEEFYTYDNAGNMLSKTDRNGNTIINKYDSLNNLVAVSAEGEKGKVNEYLKYTYGKTNLLEKEENENLTASYTHDSLGRIVSISESNGVKKEYTYNLNNNRIKFILSVNGTIKSHLTYEYDTLSRLMKVHGNGKEKAFYAYDENGNRSYMKLGNGVETEYTYNNANLIMSLKNKSGEELLSSYGYTYYLDGNQESKTDNKGVKTTYVYDNLGRLTSERQTALDKDTSWAYEYDEAHNRSKMTVNRNGEPEVTDYTYDKNNRLLREISINAATGVKTLSSYAYDKNGNQLSKMSDVIAPSDISLDASLRIYILGDYSKNEDGESFNNPNKQGLLESNTYDVFNRLRIVRSESITVEYGYRGDGLRILKTVNGETTTHVWDGSNMVAELDSSLDVKDIYIRGINLISSEENGSYVYNAHGDVVQLSDNDGSITKEYVYDAFGVEEDIDEDDDNLFRYCAEYFDKETGNIYLRARYYVPSLGRFMSEDSVRDGLNWYTYCENNPIRFIDPSGNSMIPQIIYSPAFYEWTNKAAENADLFYIILEAAGLVSEKSDYFQVKKDVIIMPLNLFNTIRSNGKKTIYGQLETDLLAEVLDSINYVINGDIVTIYRTEKKEDSKGSGKDEYKTKKKVNGKQKDDIPDRFKGEKPKKGESGKEAAKRVLEDFGEYNPKDTGPGSDFNRLKKYFDTHFE